MIAWNSKFAVPRPGHQFFLGLGAWAAATQIAYAQVATPPNASSTVSLTGGTTWVAPADVAIYTVAFLVFAATLVAILVIRGALGAKANWSLADALSEEVELTAWDRTVNPPRPLTDQSGATIKVTEMRASSSRVIALMGMVMILLMFLGFGVMTLYSFGKTGSMPSSIDEVIKFIVAGMTMFAPYLVNKFASLFAGLSGSKA